MTEHDTHDGPIRLDGDLAVATDEQQQLAELSVRALTELLGSAPETDEDGDIAIPVHGFGVFVTVAEDTPELHVWASLLSEVAGGPTTAELVTELSEEWPRLRFAVQQGHLLVSTILDADPFTPQHLVNLVGEIHELTHELDDEFAARFGGVLDCDTEDDSYAGECGGGGCGDGCACSHDSELGTSIQVGEPDA
ncbi:MAG: hypothetical protein WAX14_24275 [Rhodococcus sp. (in: high G+C Gram-positive bacteria)]|uniref:T3SS (YopN, CesT) and YbjN peptide-binding chaperone 1 n=1 Tax=Rhodococcus sp. TaxID=1831 RepID=UPI003BB7C9B4